MPEISVIVPVYKVEKYLSACVESILSQTFVDFELILIDDGSPDNCGKICDTFAHRDSRVRVVHQENRGLSGARNTGMDIAQGKYITFIDSDDVVSYSYLLELYSALKNNDADMAVCASYDLHDHEIKNLSLSHDKLESGWKCYDSKNALLNMYAGARETPIGAICKLFNHKLISDLRFPEGRLHEDQAYTPIAYYRAKKIVFSDAPIYFYRLRDESITHTRFSEKRYDDLWAIDSCIEFFREKGEQEIVEAALRRRQRILCSYAIYAHRDGVEVPEQYQISLIKALWYLRKNVSADKYQYCLSQVYPKLVIWDAYARKFDSIFAKGAQDER